MKSIKRGERLTILLIVLFLLGMVLLVARIVSQATFYMSHSHNVKLGNIYDRNGAVLFDENATAEKYGADYFLDVGNLIGDNSKTTPLLTSTRGLNCCVECQQIRLLGDPSYNVKNF